MASPKAHLFLSLNLLFYVLSTFACGTCGGYVTPPGRGGGGGRGPVTRPGVGIGVGGKGPVIPPGGGSGPVTPPGGGGGGGPVTPPGGGGGGGPVTPPVGGGGGGGGGPVTPPVGGGGGGGPVTPPGGGGGGGNMGRCPRDALKLGVCANVLGGLLGVVIGNPPTLPCCSLLTGLVDLEAAVCLCTAIRANVLGINLNIPLSLSLLLNVCGRNTPPGFTC